MYQSKLNVYKEKLHKLTGLSNWHSRIRFVIFFTGISSIIYSIDTRTLSPGMFIFAGSIIGFIIVLFKHMIIKEQITLTTNLIKINEDALIRSSDQWSDFKDTGEEFISHTHEYSYDLDLFGKGSLYQWINVCQTNQGMHLLKEMLTTIPDNGDIVLNRQKAVKELGPKIDWRQEFEAYGRNINAKQKDTRDLISWAQNDSNDKLSPILQILSFLLPIITIATFIIFLSVNIQLSFISLLLLIIQVIIIATQAKKIHTSFNYTLIYKDSLSIYSILLSHIETKQFSSAYLTENKNLLNNKTYRHASRAIKKLSGIVDLINMRNSSIHALVNFITLWDLHCYRILIKWKNNVSRDIQNWFKAIGTFEAMSSLSIIHHDNNNWCFPKLDTESYSIKGQEIGHPLIPQKERISNNFALEDKGTIAIVTGSNMSGKSTLLRTIGINLVLAYTGAPTCAQNFSCSLFSIYSSMRVNDNLEKNISSFYAELLRVKILLDAIKQGKKIFYLLDEIFKGTNLHDRQVGAFNILKFLNTSSCIGMVSTHDLDITNFAKDKSNVHNYFFKETYINDKIHFDYTLHNGVSNTSDALYLMKMIGLAIEE